MDNGTQSDSRSVEAENTLAELWQFSARQTVALEGIAASMRFILGAAETVAIWYLVFYIGSAVVTKIFSKVEP